MTSPKVSTKTPKSLFIVVASVEITNLRQLEQAAAVLIGYAERAYSCCDFGTCRQVGQRLSSTPYAELFQGYGAYYTALAVNRLGRGDPARALTMFQEAASVAADPLRARALVGAGVAARSIGQYGQAYDFYSEALAITKQPATALLATKGKAVLDALIGDHRRALDGLTRAACLLPLAFEQDRRAALDYQNSLAVELAHCGRFREARQVINTVLRSPFARYHEAWRETLSEIEAADPPRLHNRVYVPDSFTGSKPNLAKLFEFKRYAEEHRAKEEEYLENLWRESGEWELEHGKTLPLMKKYAPAMEALRHIQRSVDAGGVVTVPSLA